MNRPLRANRETIADHTLTLRLTHEDRGLLERLVELRSVELASEGVVPTVAGYVRGLIRREAAARGLLKLHEAPSPSEPPGPENEH